MNYLTQHETYSAYGFFAYLARFVDYNTSRVSAGSPGGVTAKNSGSTRDRPSRQQAAVLLHALERDPGTGALMLLKQVTRIRIRWNRGVNFFWGGNFITDNEILKAHTVARS